jgi:hypothetical protein
LQRRIFFGLAETRPEFFVSWPAAPLIQIDGIGVRHGEVKRAEIEFMTGIGRFCCKISS